MVVPSPPRAWQSTVTESVVLLPGPRVSIMPQIEIEPVKCRLGKMSADGTLGPAQGIRHSDPSGRGQGRPRALERSTVKPMIGVLGVAPVHGAVLTLDNGPHGGNLDVQETFFSIELICSRTSASRAMSRRNSSMMFAGRPVPSAVRRPARRSGALRRCGLNPRPAILAMRLCCGSSATYRMI
jgi:hypothetical protein